MNHSFFILGIHCIAYDFFIYIVLWVKLVYYIILIYNNYAVA